MVELEECKPDALEQTLEQSFTGDIHHQTKQNKKVHTLRSRVLIPIRYLSEKEKGPLD